MQNLGKFKVINDLPPESLPTVEHLSDLDVLSWDQTKTRMGGRSVPHLILEVQGILNVVLGEAQVGDCFTHVAGAINLSSITRVSLTPNNQGLVQVTLWSL